MRKIIILSLVLLAGCGGNPAPPHNETSQGVTVIGSLTQSEIGELHRQLNDLTIAARNAGYEPIPITDFTIEIVPPDSRCSDRQAFTISQQVPPGTNYDQSQYDLDDRIGFITICAAGRYFSPNHPPERIQVTREGIEAGVAVKYEGEHWTLYHRNRPLYDQTATHTPKTPHPLF